MYLRMCNHVVVIDHVSSVTAGFDVQVNWSLAQAAREPSDPNDSPHRSPFTDKCIVLNPSPSSFLSVS